MMIWAQIYPPSLTSFAQDFSNFCIEGHAELHQILCTSYNSSPTQYQCSGDHIVHSVDILAVFGLAYTGCSSVVAPAGIL